MPNTRSWLSARSYDRMYLAFFLVVVLALGVQTQRCIPRHFEYNSFVCVCNATYCDSAPDPDPKILAEGQFYWYTSNKDGARLDLSKGTFSNKSLSGISFIVDSDKTYQSIIGYGGAFTDAAGININSLSKKTQENLIKSYFGPTGSKYNLGRIPIGGCDFSTRPYSYDSYDNDITLQHFSLTMEDYTLKIPIIKRALKYSPDIKFFGAAWSAPSWMKTNDNVNGLGFLKPEYYQTYADYIIKFIDSYKKNGIDMWAISTGNEPLDVYNPVVKFNDMGWTSKTLSTWITNNYGPTLKNSKYNNTCLLALDDQRFLLPWYIDLLFSYNQTIDYVDGIAVHWYFDTLTSPTVLDETHDHYPNKFLIMTEACSGSFPPIDKPPVKLGSWNRCEDYITDIVENMNHWMSGWVDWNLALNRIGGPNWVKNYVDSAIIVNPETDEFFKQPTYYAIQHVSKFVKRGSNRIGITDSSVRKVAATAFLTPEKETIVVLYNKDTVTHNVSINDTKRGIINIELPAHSIHTIVYV